MAKGVYERKPRGETTGLTPLEQNLVRAYPLSHSITAAGKTAGYATVNSARLALKRPHVRKALEEIFREAGLSNEDIAKEMRDGLTDCKAIKNWNMHHRYCATALEYNNRQTAFPGGGGGGAVDLVTSVFGFMKAVLEERKARGLESDPVLEAKMVETEAPVLEAKMVETEVPVLEAKMVETEAPVKSEDGGVAALTVKAAAVARRRRGRPKGRKNGPPESYENNQPAILRETEQELSELL